MEILIDRKYKKEGYTIGRLYINGELFCNTLEDRDRGLTTNMTLEEINSRKVYGETAIPRGTYRVDMDTISPKYSKIKWYKDLCGGKMPRVLYVPGFDGILFHPGVTAKDSLGCILVGKNTLKGKLTSSKDTFKELYNKMLEAHNRGEYIILKIY